MGEDRDDDQRRRNDDHIRNEGTWPGNPGPEQEEAHSSCERRGDMGSHDILRDIQGEGSQGTMAAGRGEEVGGGKPAAVLKRKRRERMITEKQYAAILDAIDKAKQELLLKLTEIMNEQQAEENRCDYCRWAYENGDKYVRCALWHETRPEWHIACEKYVGILREDG